MPISDRIELEIYPDHDARSSHDFMRRKSGNMSEVEGETEQIEAVRSRLRCRRPLLGSQYDLEHCSYEHGRSLHGIRFRRAPDQYDNLKKETAV